MLAKKLFFTLCCCIGYASVFGQQGNPFELLWRSSTTIYQPNTLLEDTANIPQLTSDVKSEIDIPQVAIVESTHPLSKSDEDILEVIEEPLEQEATEDAPTLVVSNPFDVGSESESSTSNGYGKNNENGSGNSNSINFSNNSENSHDNEHGNENTGGNHAENKTSPTSSETELIVLPKENITINNRKKISGVILTFIFLAIFLLLTIIVNINRGLLQKIYRASLNENYSALLYRETKHSALNYLYPMAYIIFFLNIGLLLYLTQFEVDWGNGQKFALRLLILIPSLVYFCRHSVMKVLSHIFPFSKEVNQFNFNIMIFNIVLGLILLPINLFLAYGPDIFHLPLLYGSIFIIAVIYIFRQLRGILISSRLIISNVFLFFVYLCTVEILPLLVLFKYIV